MAEGGQSPSAGRASRSQATLSQARCSLWQNTSAVSFHVLILLVGQDFGRGLGIVEELTDLLDVLFLDTVLPVDLSQQVGRGQQLHRVPRVTGARADVRRATGGCALTTPAGPAAVNPSEEGKSPARHILAPKSLSV